MFDSIDSALNFLNCIISIPVKSYTYHIIIINLTRQRPPGNPSHGHPSSYFGPRSNNLGLSVENISNCSGGSFNQAATHSFVQPCRQVPLKSTWLRIIEIARSFSAEWNCFSTSWIWTTWMIRDGGVMPSKDLSIASKSCIVQDHQHSGSGKQKEGGEVWIGNYGMSHFRQGGLILANWASPNLLKRKDEVLRRDAKSILSWEMKSHLPTRPIRPFTSPPE